jgi:glycosyltransferase involved in cell wall biosynthesis
MKEASIKKNTGKSSNPDDVQMISHRTPEILFLTPFLPREHGIATYSRDLVEALKAKFKNSFKIRICALENEIGVHKYKKDVKYVLNTQHSRAFKSLANIINHDDNIQMVVIQHEFGFFAESSAEFMSFLKKIKKTKVTAFHTVLPDLEAGLKDEIKEVAIQSDAIIVITQRASDILTSEYGISKEKINVIPHGTYLVPHTDKVTLKEKYSIGNRPVLSTFGLLNPDKSIETTLNALAAVIRTKPEVLFLILGKTSTEVLKMEGEKYRDFLEAKVAELGLEHNVKFINKYLPLEELLEYLQLTDIYLSTSKDQKNAVSGTLAHAISCGCAIISTPIPHAVEFLGDEAGIIVDFENPEQLSDAVNKLLFDVDLRHIIKTNAYHKMVSTAWENSALAHGLLFKKLSEGKIELHHAKPEYNMQHVKKMTTNFGIIRYSKLNLPDKSSGYTLDDNARALLAFCQHYEITKEKSDLDYIGLYLDFIDFCQQPDGTFLNYVSIKQKFSPENDDDNLDDANGRAVWALGYLISVSDQLNKDLRQKAETILEKMMVHIEEISSPRAMSFIIKGLYYYNLKHRSKAVRLLITKLADRLTQMYLKESSKEWLWFESYMTYANSLLPEALIYAYRETQEDIYQTVAKTSFDFLLSQTFNDKMEIKVISNKNLHQKGNEKIQSEEQPIDVAYTIFALSAFYDHYREDEYQHKIEMAFEWFLGRNHLQQIIYNPRTGGCYDRLERNSVNVNQGAESTLSYLLARLCMEKNEIRYQSGESQVIKLKHENYRSKVS